MTESHRPLPEVLETVYLDDDLKRVHDSEQPVVENTENPGYSKAIMKLFRRAKKAGEKNDARSRKIVKAQNKERKKMDRKKKKAAKVVKPPAKPVQRTIADFGGN